MDLLTAVWLLTLLVLGWLLVLVAASAATKECQREEQRAAEWARAWAVPRSGASERSAERLSDEAA